MNEPGQTSVTPPPWWEQTGRDRIAAALVAARSGDQAAWAELVDRTAPLLWSVLRAAELDQKTAEQIAQQVYLRLTQDLDRIDDENALLNWVPRIARWAVLDRSALSGHERPPSVPSRYAQVDHAFGRLSTAERRLLGLALTGGMSYAEVAKTLDMPVGSIGPTRDRVLRKVLKLMDALPAAPPASPEGTAREELETALRALPHGETRPAPERNKFRSAVNVVARFFGFLPPPPVDSAADEDLVVAACRDVTSATRDTLRAFMTVLSEHHSLTRHAGDRS